MLKLICGYWRLFKGSCVVCGGPRHPDSGARVEALLDHHYGVAVGNRCRWCRNRDEVLEFGALSTSPLLGDMDRDMRG